MTQVQDRFPTFVAAVLRYLQNGERHTQDIANYLRRERVFAAHSERATAVVAHRLRLMVKAGLIRWGGVRLAPVNRFSNLSRCVRLHPTRVTFWSLPP